MNKERYKFIVIGLLVLFYITINLLTLCKFPSVWRDDAWMGDPAWHFLKYGNFGSSLFEGFYGLDKTDTYHGRIHLISLAIAFKFLGCGPYQARIVSFLSGLLAGLFVYQIGKKLFNNEVGLTGAILFLISKQFLVNSHWARQEMMLTLFIVITIYLYLLAKERNSLVLSFLCGLIASLSLDVHLNGIMLPIVVGALFLFEYRLDVFKQKIFLVYFSGVIIGIIYWIVLHILPNPTIFWQQWDGLNKEKFNLPVFSGKNLLQLLNLEIKKYINYILYVWRGEKYFNILEILLIVIAMIFGARSSKKSRAILLIIIFTFILSSALLINHKSSFYIVYLYPFFMLLIASFSFFSKNQLKIKFGKIMILALSFLYIFQNGYRLIEFKENNYYSYLKKIKSFIPSGCAVAGQPTWWYGFYDQKYYALAVFNLENSFSSIIREKDIKYVLFDDYWKENNSEGVKDFLKKDYLLIATLQDKFYGGEALPCFPNSSLYKLEIYKVKDEY